MIDNKGRLFKRVSVVDVVIIVAILAVLVGFFYRQTSDGWLRLFFRIRRFM